MLRLNVKNCNNTGKLPAQTIHQEQHPHQRPVKTEPLVKKCPIWNNLKETTEEINEKILSQSLSGSCVELRRYFNGENPESREADPLMWWKEHAAQYPRLQELSEKYLRSPASSVPPEQLFSKVGELMSLRSNLSESKVI